MLSQEEPGGGGKEFGICRLAQSPFVWAPKRGTGPRVAPQDEAVASPRGVLPGVKARWSPPDLGDPDIAWRNGVQRPLEVSWIPFIWCFEAHYLAEGVHACVGASRGVGDHPSVDQLAKSLLQHPLDRAALRLALPTCKTVPHILDDSVKRPIRHVG